MLLSCVCEPSPPPPPRGLLPLPAAMVISIGGRGTAESPPSPPLHPHPIWDSPPPKRRIFVTASVWRLRKEVMILDSDGDRFLLLPIFDRTPVSRDIDCWILAKTSEILAGADILSTPIFCDIPAWRAGTNRPVQCGRESAHKSGAVSVNQSLGDCMRTGQHLQGGEHQRGLGEASYCGLCWAKTVRRCSAGLVHNLRMRQHFVGAYILLTPNFCWRLYFVGAYILSTHSFCQRLTFVDAYILSTPNFCRRLAFVDAYI
jgi:hypothetical protein